MFSWPVCGPVFLMTPIDDTYELSIAEFTHAHSTREVLDSFHPRTSSESLVLPSFSPFFWVECAYNEMHSTVNCIAYFCVHAPTSA